MKSVESRAQSGEIELHVEQLGSGDPLLLISGLGYGSWCWQEMRQRLCASRRVITFDNRGTGRSGKPAGPYSMEMLADDAVAVLKHLDVTSADVVGHSMGGYISLTLAQNHPLRVRSLALVCTSPGGPKTESLPEETLAAWGKAAGLPVEENVRATMPITFSLGWPEAHPDEYEDILRRRLEYATPPECWMAQYMACGDYLVRGIEVENINIPTLVIHGSDDRIVPCGNGRQLARRLPNNRYVELPGNGHLPYLEDPDAMATLIEDHLSGQLQGIIKR